MDGRVMVPKGDSRPWALDLCCGAGGFALALQAARFRHLGFDSWQPAIDTHLANGMDAKLGDVMTMDWSEWAGKVEVIVGGPPCQPFSAAGDGRGEWDERDCIPGFIRAVREVQPEWFVMENVRGLTFKKHRGYLARVIGGLENAGYRVEWQVLNAEEYGVPQTRQRLIVIGVRRDTKRMPRWPVATHRRYKHTVAREDGDQSLLPWVSMADALGWKQAWGESYPRTWGAGMTSGATAGAAPRSPAEPIATLTGKGTAYLETAAGEGRRITPAECQLLQTFPADYVFTGNRGARHKQIGNAIPPLLASAIIEANR